MPTKKPICAARSDGRKPSKRRRQSRPLDDQFFCIATQNPFDAHGTFQLPYSQLTVSSFAAAVAIQLLRKNLPYSLTTEPTKPSLNSNPNLARAASPTTSSNTQRSCGRSVRSYLLDVIQATRGHEHIQAGLITRAAIGGNEPLKHGRCWQGVTT